MKRRLLNTYLDLGLFQHMSECIINKAQLWQSEYICVVNVHMLIEAYQDPTFSKIINNAALCTPDGMPLVIALKLLYGIEQERVAGMDLLPDLLLEAEKRGLPVYFYGGTQAMLNQTDQYLKERYPALAVAGLHSPPFRPLTVEEIEADVQRINDSGARMLFVALGCPKQEKWMAAMQGKIHMPMIGIGGALPVMIGMQRRAPLWMQRASLEWLYRFIQEPGRLWKRYLVTNTLFIFLLIRQIWRVRVLKTE